MKRSILIMLLMVSCKPRQSGDPTPIPVQIENRRLQDQDGNPAAWNVACVDGVEYLWAYNVGITPKIRRMNDKLIPTLCEVR